MKKWSYSFIFCDTEDIAKTICTRHMEGVSAYVKKKYPAVYTPWSSADGKESCFVAWVPAYSVR